jgi:hypothetical protein
MLGALYQFAVRPARGISWLFGSNLHDSQSPMTGCTKCRSVRLFLFIATQKSGLSARGTSVSFPP